MIDQPQRHPGKQYTFEMAPHAITGTFFDKFPNEMKGLSGSYESP